MEGRSISDRISSAEAKINIPSPLQQLRDEEFSNAGIEIFVKRDDLIHPEISGNKWRKLKYNLQFALEAGHEAIATIGGAFSNHLKATAFAANLLGLRSIGFVRWHEIDLRNPTLKSCHEIGMRLVPIGRSSGSEIISKVCQEESAIFIPEGGSNMQGRRGVAELILELPQNLVFDHVYVSLGSGGTLAGLIDGFNGSSQVTAVSSFSDARIVKMMAEDHAIADSQFEHIHEPSLGGFGKYRSELISFCSRVMRDHNLPLDPIYTVKTLKVLWDRIHSDQLKFGAKILIVHTGGLQGWDGFRYVHRGKEMPYWI